MTRLEAAGRALLGDPSLTWRVELAEPDFLALQSKRGRAVLLEYDPEHPYHWRLSFERVVRAALGTVHVVVFGGDDRLRAELTARALSADARRLRVYHVDERGAVWQSRPAAWRRTRLVSSLERSFDEALLRRRWSAAEATSYAERVRLEQAASRSEAAQMDRFRQALSQRAPVASLVIVLLIGAVFALQWLWGGVDLPPLLASMGSMVPERARDGQWWRYFSCTFLHGGTLHVALNGFVLWMLGRSLERFVGSARFLVVYCAAGLAGSISSSFFVTSQSVGASGAIWGLLGAEAALAFYPRPLLPPALIAVARRTAAANLGLNLVNSFNPHVDLAAHVGGGLMGAGVLSLMALSGQLPAYDRPRIGGGMAMRLAATISSCAFAIGLLVAMLQGRPWQLGEFPELERVQVPGSSWTAELPRGLSASRPSDGETSSEFGNLAYDACVVDITWVPLPRAEAALDLQHELSMIQSQLAAPPAGLEQVLAPRVLEHGALAYVGVRYRYASNQDVVDDRAIGIVDGAFVRVDVIGWAGLPRSFDGLAPRVLASLSRSLHASGGPRRQRVAPVFHSGGVSPQGVGRCGVEVARHGLGEVVHPPFLECGASSRGPRQWRASAALCRTPRRTGDGVGQASAATSSTLWQGVNALFSYTLTLKRKGTAPPRIL